ncbi:MFS transporter [Paraburkholderia sp. J63]|uniref:MFS transporter n=1 Tax=Paraburkholderia sp. J63 TaxID=2805434 RepID=UPI002ABD1C4A|nr:MFS transporter [Paraburkholderia sp. J63]
MSISPSAAHPAKQRKNHPGGVGIRQAATSEKIIDVSHEIESAPLRPFHIKLGLLISLILLFDGYDLYNTAYIVHYVAADWRLNAQQIGALLSSGLAGFAAGSTISGFFADRFGRRTALLLGCWTSSAMSLAIACFARDLHSYIVLRFVMGLSLGLLMPVAITYINEIAPSRASNLFTAWFFSLGWLGGASAAGLVAAWLAPRYGWESLYFAGALMLPVSVWLHRLPESPHFLASRSRWAALATLLTNIQPERATTYASAQFSSPRKEKSASFRLLLSRTYMARTICFWGAGMLSLFSAYSLSTWLPTIILARGEKLSASFAYGSLLAACAVGGGLLTAAVADRIGDRRRVIASSFVLGTIAIGALARAHTPLSTVVAVAAAGAFVVGSQIVLNNLVASSYPTEIRGTGVGMFLGIGRIGAMLGPVVAGITRQLSGSYDLVFGIVAVAVLLTAILIYGSPRTSSSGERSKDATEEIESETHADEDDRY